jgi:Family of unknown function (DUF5763)
VRDQLVNTSPARSENKGPCLYLGSDGQRCNREAVEGGFCLKHHPDRKEQELGSWLRRAGAALLLLATLWPHIANVLRMLFRWLR